MRRHFTDCSVFVRLVVVIGLALMSAQCGESNLDGVEGESDEEWFDEDYAIPGLVTEQEREETRRWVEEQDTIIMPWTRVLDEDVVEDAIVEEDRIRFPLSTESEVLDSLETMDIVVSTHLENPFLKRITDIEQTDEHLVLHVRRAVLTEAVYKGEISSQPPGQPLDGLQTRRQPSEEGPFEKFFGDVFGELKSEYLTGDIPDGSAHAGLRVRPFVDIEGDWHFDLRINPLRGIGLEIKIPNHNQYFGSRRCDSDDDCHLLEVCEVPSQAGVDDKRCLWDVPTTFTDGTVGNINYQLESCADIIRFLETAEDHDHCAQQWNDWLYSGTWAKWAGLGLGDTKAEIDNILWSMLYILVFNDLPQGTQIPMTQQEFVRVINEEFAPRYICEGEPAPFLAQVDWAKANCQGGLEMFEFDVDIENMEVGLEGFFGLAGELSDDDDFFEPRDLLTKRRVFFMGWFPVLFTFKALFKAGWEYEFEGQAGFGFTPAKVTGFNFTGGVHYYANEDATEDSRFDELVPEESKANYEYGRFQRNRSAEQPSDGPELVFPAIDPDPDLGEGNATVTDAVELMADIKLSTEVSMGLRLEALIYEAVGPFVEPATIYGQFNVDSTADDCGVGVQAGVKGVGGMTAQIPFCNDCQADLPWDLYDSCGESVCEETSIFCQAGCLAADNCDGSEGGGDGEPVYVVLEVGADDADQNGTSAVMPDGVNLSTVIVRRAGQDDLVAQAVFIDDQQPVDSAEKLDVLGHEKTAQEQSQFLCQEPLSDPDHDEWEQAWAEHTVSFGESMVLEFAEPIEADDIIDIRKPRTFDGYCIGTGQNVSVSISDDVEATLGAAASRFNSAAGDRDSTTAQVVVQDCADGHDFPQATCWPY